MSKTISFHFDHLGELSQFHKIMVQGMVQKSPTVDKTIATIQLNFLFKVKFMNALWENSYKKQYANICQAEKPHIDFN